VRLVVSRGDLALKAKPSEVGTSGVAEDRLLVIDDVRLVGAPARHRHTREVVHREEVVRVAAAEHNPRDQYGVCHQGRAENPHRQIVSAAEGCTAGTARIARRFYHR
jgi:hypothetical protein